MPMEPDTKDFLLHLYDKLWENMAAKEGRLWNYLSVYGAAIALSLGVGQYAGVELYAVMIVLALTVWALLIVINANWWYQRNHLMVTQIEKRFAAGGGLNGVIPESYRDGIFQVDRLYRGSVLVLSAVASLLYVKIMWQYHTPPSFSGTDAVVSVGMLYCLFVASVAYCVSQHESYIGSFYSIKSDLLKEAGGMNVNDIEKKVKEEQKRAYENYGWSTKGLLFILLGIVAFDILPGRSAFHLGGWTTTGLILQGLVVLIYFVVIKISKHEKHWWRRTWLVQLTATAVIVGSALIFLSVDFRCLQTPKVGTAVLQSKPSKADESAQR